MGPTPMAYMQTPMGLVPVLVQPQGHWAPYPPASGYPPPGMTQVTAQHSELGDGGLSTCGRSVVYCDACNMLSWLRGDVVAPRQGALEHARADSRTYLHRGTTLCHSRRRGMRRRCRSTQLGRRQCRRHRPIAASRTLPTARLAHPRRARLAVALVCHWHRLCPQHDLLPSATKAHWLGFVIDQKVVTGV